MALPTSVADRWRGVVGPASARSLAVGSLAIGYGTEDRLHERTQAGSRPTAFEAVIDRCEIDPGGRS